MDENQKSPSVIESLAIITDALQSLFPEGKIICLYELNEEDFKKVQDNFRKIDSEHTRFSIDISDLEHVFINKEKQVFFEEPVKVPKKTLKQKILSWFESRKSSVK